jgi:hypothetical protein
MSANSSVVADEYGNYEDWIELYNLGNEPVNLEGFGLSDNPNNLFKWTFHDVVIEPDEYLLVWASGRDLKPASGWKEGFIHEVFKNIPGSTINDLIDYHRFPDHPDERDLLTNGFEAPSYIGDNYGQRMHGYLEAPETGLYIFWIASDDTGLLTMSTDDFIGNARDIASVPGWTYFREYEKYPEQKSDPVFLEQGKRYYLRALMKEATGGDHLSVRWQLPSGDIQDPIPGTHFFWKEGQPHTNFAISSQGETITLTRPDSVVVDQFDAIVLPTNFSYGRKPDGTGSWAFFDHPTPGRANITSSYEGILEPPYFSSPGGIFSHEFELHIFHDDPSVTIFYTLDGSIPDPENTQGGTFQYKKRYRKEYSQADGALIDRAYITYEYTGPVTMQNKTGAFESQTDFNSVWEQNPVSPRKIPLTGTVIRAIAFKEGYMSSDVSSGTYIFRNQPYPVPVISLVVPQSSFFSYDDGIYVPGKTFDNWRSNNWGASVQGNSPANFQNSGSDWEREVNVEYFNASGQPVFNQRAGARIHGGWSRSFHQKSIRLYARNEYGNPEFNYQFFEDKPTDTFKRLLLRASGNDQHSTFFRDAMIQRLVRNRPIDIQHWQPSVTFINGEYWGILNIRDRVDNYYLHYEYGVDPENVDVLTGGGSIKYGVATHYNDMINFIRSNDLNDPEHYAHINTLMDTDNFAEYCALQIYANNQDWPQNNIDFWRNRTSSYRPDAPYGHDGRWRWIVFDTDFGFWIWENGPWENTLAHATHNNWSTELLRNLLKNQDFQHKLINRFADLMNTVFHPDTILQTIDEMQMVYEPIIDDHIDRWHRISNRANWTGNINKMKDFAVDRPTFMRQHIHEYFDLAGCFEITASVGSGQGKIRINTIELENPSNWKGLYFKGVPVEIEAIACDNFIFSHWEGDYQMDDSIIGFTSDVNVNLVAHFFPFNSPVLIHNWLFDDNMVNNTPLQSVNTTYHASKPGALVFESSLEGYPFDPSHVHWRKSSIERRNMPTEINYRPAANDHIPFSSSNMRGLQVRQPFQSEYGQNTLLFHLPTNGFKDLIFSFAVRDELAAEYLVVDYSADNGENWLTAGIENATMTLSGDYQLFQVDFTGIENVDNNDEFIIRLRFEGSDMTADLGSRVTFNNISLEGFLIDAINYQPYMKWAIPLQIGIENGEAILIDLGHYFSDPDGDPLSFAINTFANEFIETEIENGILAILPLRRGEAILNLSVSDGINPAIEHNFRVLIYPQAHSLADSDFVFEAWDADHPEHVYPPHMLFLQSEVSDPDMEAELLFPYHIVPADYHADDYETIGFPYNNTGFTRINGLGVDGISFINTGRSHDLGGALVAVNTTGQDNIMIQWKGGTLKRNERLYAIGLQYRVGVEGPFHDLVYQNQSFQYMAGNDGDELIMGPIKIPDSARKKEYVQFLWRYHHVEGNTGQRSQLRLDDVFVGYIEIDDTGLWSDGSSADIALFPNPASHKINIHSSLLIREVEVLDIQGKAHLRVRPMSLETSIDVASLQNGIYFVRLLTVSGVSVRRMIINSNKL